jgi:hypothetical protein
MSLAAALFGMSKTESVQTMLTEFSPGKSKRGE